MSFAYYEGSKHAKLVDRFLNTRNLGEEYSTFADQFTEEEIDQLFEVNEMCWDSINLRYTSDGDFPFGWHLKSNDEDCLVLMQQIKDKQKQLAERLRNSLSIENQMEDEDEDDYEVDCIDSKAAWNKYIDYCQSQIEKLPADSADCRYYKGEIAKAKSELDRQ